MGQVAQCKLTNGTVGRDVLVKVHKAEFRREVSDVDTLGTPNPFEKFLAAIEAETTKMRMQMASTSPDGSSPSPKKSQPLIIDPKSPESPVQPRKNSFQKFFEENWEKNPFLDDKNPFGKFFDEVLQAKDNAALDSTNNMANFAEKSQELVDKFDVFFKNLRKSASSSVDVAVTEYDVGPFAECADIDDVDDHADPFSDGHSSYQESTAVPSAGSATLSAGSAQLSAGRGDPPERSAPRDNKQGDSPSFPEGKSAGRERAETVDLLAEFNVVPAGQTVEVVFEGNRALLEIRAGTGCTMFIEVGPACDIVVNADVDGRVTQDTLIIDGPLFSVSDVSHWDEWKDLTEQEQKRKMKAERTSKMRRPSANKRMSFIEEEKNTRRFCVEFANRCPSNNSVGGRLFNTIWSALSLGELERCADPGRRIPLSVDVPVLPGVPPWIAATREGDKVTNVKQEPLPKSAGDEAEGRPVIIGTLRMGFGHLRIALGLAQWLIAVGAKPFVIDLTDVAPDAPEAGVTRRADTIYSGASRLASEVGGAAEAFWGSVTTQGDMGSLVSSCQLASRLQPLLNDLPRDIPYISTHPLAGQVAVSCGFENVINLVVDNLPQVFALVPGALNLVQSPSYLQTLLEWGVPADKVKHAGHWVSRDVAINAIEDCKARLQRAQSTSCRHVLLAIGGAGAQLKFFQRLIKGLGPAVRQGRLRVYINAGDLEENHFGLEKKLIELKMPYHKVTQYDELSEICQQARGAAEGQEDLKGVVLCTIDEKINVVRATDTLIRAMDVLISKPSELAFYPVPKINIRRVGDHEAISADRSAELGDGTREIREVANVVHYLDLICNPSSGLFQSMVRQIMGHASLGVYNGCSVATESLTATIGKQPGEARAVETTKFSGGYAL